MRRGFLSIGVSEYRCIGEGKQPKIFGSGIGVSVYRCNGENTLLFLPPHPHTPIPPYRSFPDTPVPRHPVTG